MSLTVAYLGYVTASVSMRLWQKHVEERALPSYMRGAFEVRHAHERRMSRVVASAGRRKVGASGRV